MVGHAETRVAVVSVCVCVCLCLMDVIGAGYVILDEDKRVRYWGQRFMGMTTNNVAEYTALIDGLTRVKKELRGVRVRVEGDSKLVLNQVFGTWKIKASHLKPMCAQAKKLQENVVRAWGWIPRASNGLADARANAAMDVRRDATG